MKNMFYSWWKKHYLDAPIAFMSIDEASYIWEAAQDSLYLEIQNNLNKVNDAKRTG